MRNTGPREDSVAGKAGQHDFPLKKPCFPALGRVSPGGTPSHF